MILAKRKPEEDMLVKITGVCFVKKFKLTELLCNAHNLQSALQIIAETTKSTPTEGQKSFTYT
jgi:hypothetical protein